MLKPLPDLDAEWLRKLDKLIWTRTTDRFGSVHAFENLKRAIQPDELQRVLNLIRLHRLPCILHSGPYGNLSMSICAHSESPEVKPDVLCHLGEDHVEVLKTKKGFGNWDERFRWFSRFTHNKENEDLLKFYKLPLPQEKERYAY